MADELAGTEQSVAEKVIRHESLAAAKKAVMESVGYCLRKNAQGLSYPFVSESDLIGALRPVMVVNGITVSPVKSSIVFPQEYQSSKGSRMGIVRVQVTYRFTHVDTGQFEDVEVCGEGGDMGDKAVPKAMTSAFKYALRQAFMMETGDDPDKFASQPLVAASMALERQAQEDSYRRALSAVSNADSMERLDQYRKKYRQMGYTQEQVSELERAFGARQQLLNKQRNQK